MLHDFVVAYLVRQRQHDLIAESTERRTAATIRRAAAADRRRRRRGLREGSSR